MMAVISDFLFDNPRAVLQELSELNGAHDVFIVLIDAAFAFELPSVAAGWIEVLDVETGRARTVSRRALLHLADTVREWQADVHHIAKDLDLDVVEISIDATRADVALSQFVADRRLRRTRN